MHKKFYFTLLALGMGKYLSAQVALPEEHYSPRDTNTLSEVLIQENRIQLPFEKQSRNIQIIDQKYIQQLPARSINEILSYVAGVDLRQRGPFGSQADVSIDGGSFEQTMVLINGVKVADAQTGHHALNIPIPTDGIERIEILKGPAARIYGINSLTGAINIVTKKPLSNTLSVHLYSGSSFQNNQQASSGKYYGKGAQLSSSWVHNKQTHQLYYGHEDGNGYRYNTAFNANRLYYQGNLEASSNHAYQVAAGYLSNSFGANGFYSAPGDKDSYESIVNVFTALSSTHKINSELTISPRFSNRYQEDDYRYLGRELAAGRSKHYTNTFSTEINANLNKSYGEFGFGLETRIEDISSSSIGKHSRDNYGAYLEFKTENIKRLLVNIGAYVNYNTRFKWQVFPGIDLGYHVNPNWRIVFHSGSAQRIPSFTDLYLTQKGNIGNPDLNSENAWQSELGFKYLHSNLVFQGSYFYRRIDHFIDWIRSDIEQPWQPANRGLNELQGINAHLKYTLHTSLPNTKFFVNLGYNYLIPSLRSPETGISSKYELESLRNQLIANLTAEYKNFSFTTANRYNERISYKSYYISDLRLAFSQSKYRLYLDAQNLFNVSFIEAAAVPMPGRWFTAGVKYSIL